MQISISKALVLEKTLKQRIHELTTMRNESLITRRSFYGDNKEEKVPMYDAKELDKQILELQRIVYKLDVQVKESNSVTSIHVPDEVEDILFTKIG